MHIRGDKGKFTLAQGTQPPAGPVLVPSDHAPRQAPRSLIIELRAFLRYLITGKTDARNPR